MDVHGDRQLGPPRGAPRGHRHDPAPAPAAPRPPGGPAPVPGVGGPGPRRGGGGGGRRRAGVVAHGDGAGPRDRRRHGPRLRLPHRLAPGDHRSGAAWLLQRAPRAHQPPGLLRAAEGPGRSGAPRRRLVQHPARQPGACGAGAAGAPGARGAAGDRRAAGTIVPRRLRDHRDRRPGGGLRPPPGGVQPRGGGLHGGAPLAPAALRCLPAPLPSASSGGSGCWSRASSGRPGRRRCSGPRTPRPASPSATPCCASGTRPAPRPPSAGGAAGARRPGAAPAPGPPPPRGAAASGRRAVTGGAPGDPAPGGGGAPGAPRRLPPGGGGRGWGAGGPQGRRRSGPRGRAPGRAESATSRTGTRRRRPTIPDGAAASRASLVSSAPCPLPTP